MNAVSEATAAELSGNVFVDGPNFSGRTNMVRAFAGLQPGADPRRPRRAYVGPEIYNAISGLRATVKSELELNRASDCDGLDKLISSSALARLLVRNPFTLSGGEQALLAIVAAIASGRDVCAVDCAAEQLDQNNRQLLFRWMREHSPLNGAIRLIVDNRMPPGEFWNCVHLENSEIQAARLRPNAFRAPELESTTIGMDDVWFRYGKGAEWVFRRCSIMLEPGKTYILKGPNGAGKSTWAKLLTGVLKPVQGVITSADRSIDVWGQPGRLVGYHFQNPDLQLFCESVEEELRQNTPLTSNLRAATLEAFGLRNVLESHPMDLSFVLRKRLALAVTISMARPWLIFDEPVLGQDRASVEAIAGILKSLVNAGTGVIIISHFEWFDELFDATHLYIEDAQIIARRHV